MTIGIDIRMIGKQRTGDEAVFFNLVKNLALIDGENDYKLFTDIDDKSSIKTIRERLGTKNKLNFEIVSLPTRNKFTWNFWTLSNYLRKNPVDIYHTQYITPFFVSREIKIVTHIHDVSFLVYPEFIKKIDLFFLKTLIPVSLRRADKIIAVSEFTKQEIIKYYGIASEKIIVAYNAVGEDFNIPMELSIERKKELQKKYNLPEKFILYIGTLQPRKNIPFLLEAYSRVKNRLSGLKLVIAGNRSARNFDSRIDKAITKNNLEKDVFFPGFIDQLDLPNLYRMTDLFVFPSLYEGFGIPIIEAMSQEVPVVASDIAIHREIAGDAVKYIKPGELDYFAKELYNISTDDNLRKRLIEAGSARQSLFSWKKSAQLILRTYQKINQQ